MKVDQMTLNLFHDILCDLIQFNYYGVIVLSVVTSVLCTKNVNIIQQGTN